MLICKLKIYNLKLGESTSKFDFERIVPVFFARTVPFDFLREFESSQGGTGFCAKRPVTMFLYQLYTKDIIAR